MENATIKSTDIARTYLPEFDGFIICGEQQSGTISSVAPSDFIDLLLNFQTFQVIKLHKKYQTKQFKTSNLSMLQQIRKKCSIWHIETYDWGDT